MTFRVFVPSLQGNATQVRLAAVGNEFARCFPKGFTVPTFLALNKCMEKK